MNNNIFNTSQSQSKDMNQRALKTQFFNRADIFRLKKKNNIVSILSIIRIALVNKKVNFSFSR